MIYNTYQYTFALLANRIKQIEKSKLCLLAYSKVSFDVFQPQTGNLTIHFS